MLYSLYQWAHPASCLPYTPQTEPASCGHGSNATNEHAHYATAAPGCVWHPVPPCAISYSSVLDETTPGFATSNTSSFIGFVVSMSTSLAGASSVSAVTPSWMISDDRIKGLQANRNRRIEALYTSEMPIWQRVS